MDRVCFGSHGYVIEAVHATCGALIEEGGLCGCPERVTQAPRSGFDHSKAYPGKVLSGKDPLPRTFHEWILNPEDSPLATSTLTCSACGFDAPPFHSRCRRCGHWRAP